MPNFGEIPRGLDDLAVYVLDAAGTPGTKVDVPGAQSLEWSVESDSDELRGDNQAIALVRNPKTVAGTIRVAKINLAAIAAMIGGSTTTSGTGATEITTLEEASAAPARYFQIVGQAASADANGSAYRITIYKALVTGGPNETLTIDEWSTPEFEFEAIANGSGMLLKRQNYATLTAIA
jgi:hypothetical protein